MIHFHGHGLHHPAAVMQPIAWVDVNMFTPQTNRAMVGIAVAFNLGAAGAANEVLNFFRKFSHRLSTKY